MQSERWYLSHLRAIGLFSDGSKLPDNPRFFRKTPAGKTILLNGKPERDWTLIMRALQETYSDIIHIEEDYRTCLDRYIIRLGGLPDQPSFFMRAKIFPECHFTQTQLSIIKEIVDPLRAEIAELRQRLDTLLVPHSTTHTNVAAADDMEESFSWDPTSF
jgi:hypothetical protein